MKLSEARYQAVLPLLLAGQSSAEIQTAAGCGTSTVSAAARRARAEGHDIRLAKRSRGKAIEQYPPNVNYIKRLREAETLLLQGASIDRLVSVLDVSEKTARRMLQSLQQLGAQICDVAESGNTAVWRLDAKTRVFSRRD